MRKPLVQERSILSQFMEIAYLLNIWQKGDINNEVENFHKLEDATKEFSNMLKRFKKEQAIP